MSSHVDLDIIMRGYRRSRSLPGSSCGGVPGLRRRGLGGSRNGSIIFRSGGGDQGKATFFFIDIDFELIVSL